MQNTNSKLRLIDYLLTREGFRRVMVTLILSSIVLTWGLGIFTGGLSRGLRESSRDGGRRFGYMSKVAQGFKERDDPYVMIFQSSKAGQAYWNYDSSDPTGIGQPEATSLSSYSSKGGHTATMAAAIA